MIGSDEFLKNNSAISEIVEHCQEALSENSTIMTVVHVTVILWKSVMSAIEWNKKEDLLAEQALRHLQVPSSLSLTISVMIEGAVLPFCIIPVDRKNLSSEN